MPIWWKGAVRTLLMRRGREVKPEITNRICPWDFAYVSCFTYKKKCSFRDPTLHGKGTTREGTDLQEQGGFAVCRTQRRPLCKTPILLSIGHIFFQDFLLGNIRGAKTARLLRVFNCVLHEVQMSWFTQLLTRTISWDFHLLQLCSVLLTQCGLLETTFISGLYNNSTSPYKSRYNPPCPHELFEGRWFFPLLQNEQNQQDQI